MSSGYADEPAVDDVDDFDDVDDLGDDTWNDGFYRGWTARSTSERECCEHQSSCPTRRRSWWQRLRGAA